MTERMCIGMLNVWSIQTNLTLFTQKKNRCWNVSDLKNGEEKKIHWDNFLLAKLYTIIVSKFPSTRCNETKRRGDEEEISKAL